MKLRDYLELAFWLACLLACAVAAAAIICAPFAIIGFVIYKCLELFR